MTPPSSSDVAAVLDVLVVGGGPGGTAAAFRARELGLSTLVVDYDDVLKRIRDYSKDKLILPDFGGGDAMRFPKGGDLVCRLHFQPIDKDDMHVSWKRLYGECEVPVQVGAEVTGLERCDGAWEVRCWDHPGRCEQRLRARHVVLALGRGVPRRFDIPGNTDGIAFRLSDPALYVGGPACVLGGGTSAAEAVIAISNAKAAADDPTAVYWSYRGDKMPRVSKALADAFFNAYMGNGNIRYYPKSEPVAVVSEDDRQEYLAIRIDRRCLEGRPSETTQLEFAKERCVACIGEDIPETLLNSFGIDLVAAGPNRKRMLVTPLLETVQPNVYLVGDILSQAYLETDDFGADPSTFREVKHRGNIKSALRDGVLVAEVIAQKLAGHTEIRVKVEDAEEAELLTPVPSPIAHPSPGRGAPPPNTEARPPLSRLGGSAMGEGGQGGEEPEPRLVRLLSGDVEENEVPLRRGVPLTLGRQGCDLSYPEDPTLSERHASIVSDADGSWLLRDDGGASGVFLRARPGEAVPVDPGTIVRAGRQFLVLSGLEVQHYDHQGREVGRHPLGDRTLLFGRDAPDVTMDAGDMSLSRRHLSLAVKEGRILLKDLKSVNGTYLKIHGSAPLQPGDEIRIGRQSFRFTARPPSPVAPEVVVARPAPAPPPPTIAPVSPKAPAGAPEVLFQGVGGPFAIRPGQTLCEIAEEHGVKLNAECHAGICGSDPIRILSGGEHLNPLEASESDTLQDLCSLKPGECRLACMVRAKGPVVVEIVRR